MNIVVVLLIVLLLFGTGGYYGLNAGVHPFYLGTGGVGGLVLVLILLRVFGII